MKTGGNTSHGKLMDYFFVSIATCDFENEKCTYKNTIESDTFDWLIGQGTTTSKWTGPLNDHSLKNGNGTYTRRWKALRSYLYNNFVTLSFRYLVLPR